MSLDISNYQEMQFNLPHDVVNLPSKGVFYKNKKKSVKVGYLTANDENILFGTRSEDLIYTLLRTKLFEPDLDPNDLTWGDVGAILLFLRNSSFGEEYNVNLIDPDTNKEFKTTILLNNITVVEAEMEPDQEGLYSVKLPKTSATVKIRPLTFGETREIDEQARTYPQGRVAPVITWRLMKHIVEINGSRDDEAKANLINELPIMDSKFIRNFIQRNEPKIDFKRMVRTPSGRDITTQIEFGPEFFRPFF